MTKPAYLRTEWTDPLTGSKGYLVIDELIDGMCGGGIRMRPGLNASEVENLARVMTAKFMAMGIPCGGAKGGIDYNPAKADSREVLKRYLLAHRPFIRECWGTSEDLGTREEDILAILQELDVNTSVHAVLSRRSAEEQSTLLGNLLKGLFLQHDGMVFTDVKPATALRSPPGRLSVAWVCALSAPERPSHL
jgi:glutamate dehydrogenase (NAD(P)+)